MKFIVKLFPEITIKSSPVRKKLIRQLRRNIRKNCHLIDPDIKAIGKWDMIEVVTDKTDPVMIRKIIERLSCTPGICHFMEVTEHPLTTLDDVLEKAKEIYAQQLAGKTFAVRIKRAGSHDFTSVEAERYIGAGLNRNTQAAGVNLRSPDVTVCIEIKNDRFFMINRRIEGMGGFPLGTQQPVLSLISGGFDSCVASYLTMKRGINTHFCFFNLGGHAHETGVKEVAYYLWERFGFSHPVRFVTVPFQAVVEDILKNADPSQMGVILKRMMLRAATAVAREMNILALSTGEAIAQVSSQTLPNLSVIDSVTDHLVLRPLIVMDKQDIIQIARKIGTEVFSKKMPEYCAVISKKPTTAANLQKIELEEKKLNFSILADAISSRKNERISELISQDDSDIISQIEFVSRPQVDDVIIDVRHPSEREVMPEIASRQLLLQIPFYQLESKVINLDRDCRYLLFCDHGIISRLHAAHLFSEGHKNFGVYLPEKT